MEFKDIEKTLKSIKTKIERAKENLSEARAQKKILLSTLKKDFGLDNILQAEEQIKKLTKDSEILYKEMEKSYKNLTEKFGFI